MTERLTTFLWAVVIAAPALPSCGGRAAGNPGSETHWLTACQADSECGEGSCLCGVCTTTCVVDSDCDGVGSSAHCVDSAEAASCGDSAEPRVCLRACDVEGDCQTEQTTDDPVCTDEDCEDAPGTTRDASAPDAPRSSGPTPDASATRSMSEPVYTDAVGVAPQTAMQQPAMLDAAIETPVNSLRPQPNARVDSGSGVSDSCEGADADEDGVPDVCDACPGYDDTALEVIDDDVFVRAQTGLTALRGVGEVTGDLTIEGAAATSITSLLDLRCLRRVGKNLTISGNDALVDLEGLNALREVGADLTFLLNGQLQNVDALTSLQRIEGTLDFTINDSLQDVAGFSSLVSIGGDVNFYANEVFASTAGFSALESIGGDLLLSHDNSLADVRFAALRSVGGDIMYGEVHVLGDAGRFDVLTTIGGGLLFLVNHALTNVDGFTALTSIGGDLDLDRNQSLQNVDGLSALVSIGGKLDIEDSVELGNVDGLRNLTELGGDLDVRGSSVLESLQGLRSLRRVGGNFSVTNNAALPTCEAEAVRDSVGAENIAGSITISGNLTSGMCH